MILRWDEEMKRVQERAAPTFSGAAGEDAVVSATPLPGLP